MGNRRVYETFDAALARFRLMPEQPCDNPFIVEFIGRHSLRRAEDGWVWKFDSEAMGSRAPAAEPVGGVRQCRAHAVEKRQRLAPLVGAEHRGFARPAEGECHRVSVVHRDPALREDVIGQWTVREQCPERKRKMGKAVIKVTRLSRAIGRIHCAPVGRTRVVARGAIGKLEPLQMIGIDVVDRHLAGMQKAEMRGVDVAFQRLQPVSFALPGPEAGLVGRAEHRLERGQRRCHLSLASPGPPMTLGNAAAARVKPWGSAQLGGFRPLSRNKQTAGVFHIWTFRRTSIQTVRR
jgi:hypothetical protein